MFFVRNDVLVEYYEFVWQGRPCRGTVGIAFKTKTNRGVTVTCLHSITSLCGNAVRAEARSALRFNRKPDPIKKAPKTEKKTKYPSILYDFSLRQPKKAKKPKYFVCFCSIYKLKTKQIVVSQWRACIVSRVCVATPSVPSHGRHCVKTKEKR